MRPSRNPKTISSIQKENNNNKKTQINTHPCHEKYEVFIFVLRGLDSYEGILGHPDFDGAIFI